MRWRLFVMFVLVERFIDIDDIVRHLLQFEDDVHIVDSGGVVVLFVGDMLQVLRLEFVAEVVDFRLYIGHLHELVGGDIELF